VTPNVDPRCRPYKPFGGAEKLFYCNAPEILYDGPRGTGKTRAVLEKVYALCYLWPGSRWLLARQTLKSLKDTVLVTWEEKVVPFGHPCLKVANRRSATPVYKVGESEVLTGGLSDPDSWRSGEFDGVCLFEGTQMKAGTLALFKGCMRNNKGSYHQIIVDTNPGGKRHHLITRARDPSTSMVRIQSVHQDNPTLWTGTEWSDHGKDFMGGLDELTGHLFARWRLGEWSSAEGLVYNEFDYDVHIIDRFEIPKTWQRVCVIDFGYTHPFVLQWWAIDGDGRAFMYREIYHTGRLVEDHVKLAKSLTGEENVRYVIADHDAEGRATVDRYWRPTVAAIKEVRRGIECVKSRLRIAGDGKPRLFLLRDSLVELDTRQNSASKPTCTEDEFDGYVWDDKKTKEQPVKERDDGMDCVRYLCTYLEDQNREVVIQWV